ncbi:MAG: ATP-binding protein [Bacteroidales bacterium]|nr:ATP-binding protein [Bacteroidales bacterium]
MKKIVITGPESTGKSDLTNFLSNHYQCSGIAESSRGYISNLKRPYTYNDLLHIANKQIDDLEKISNKSEGLVFFDTGLIVTKIWFLEVYGQFPDWLEYGIIKHKPQLYLLCYYDLPWVFDPLRENGSDERRAYLFNRYQEEIIKLGCEYKIITGFNQERFKLAIQFIDNYLYSNVEK